VLSSFNFLVAQNFPGADVISEFGSTWAERSHVVCRNDTPSGVIVLAPRDLLTALTATECYRDNVMM